MPFGYGSYAPYTASRHRSGSTTTTKATSPPHAGMGETAFEVAWAQGEAMPLKRAVEYAFSEKEEQEPPTLDPVPEQHPPAEERTERLTSREREVALLVGR